MVSEKTKRYGYKTLLGAAAIAALTAGFGAASAKADGWHEGHRYGWDRGHDRGWFGFGYRPYGYGYYPPPPVYYAPPPPVYYAPRAYYPGSFNVTIPIR